MDDKLHLNMRLAIFQVAAEIYQGYPESARDTDEAFELAVGDAVSLWHEVCIQTERLEPIPISAVSFRCRRTKRPAAAEGGE